MKKLWRGPEKRRRKKKQKEREKEERKKQREEKRKEKEKKKMCNKKTNKRARGKKSKSNDRDHDCCLECGICSDEEDDINEDQWIQCEQCMEWTHQTCAGHPNATLQELGALTYLCKACNEEEIATM